MARQSSGQARKQLRCIAHVDLDCFYCQVEVRQNPLLKGKPVGVVQYNPWESGGVVSHGPGEDRIDNSSNGSLIAVSYEARAHGVKRNMRGREARKVCPDLILVQVPTAHGKSDMQIYREAGEEVAAVIGTDADALEKASVDEAYVDLTGAATRLLASTEFSEIIQMAQDTHVAGHPGDQQTPPSPDGTGPPGTPAAQPSRRDVREGHSGQGPEAQPTAAAAGHGWFSRPPVAWDDHDQMLAAGCALMAGVREAVARRTGFTVSAGLAHGKLMAKLCSGMHKPNQQTMLPRQAVPSLMSTLPLDRVRGLGGKLGSRMTSLGLKTVGDMAAAGEGWLQKRFGDKTGHWLHRVSLGLDDEPVKDRRASMSVSSGKRYDSSQTLLSLPAAHAALRKLLGEIEVRLDAERNGKGRAPKTLTVAIGAEREANATGHISRSCPFRPGLDSMCSDLFSLIRAWASGRGAAPLRIHGLFVSATNFEHLPSRGCTPLTSFLVRQGGLPSADLPTPGSPQTSPAADHCQATTNPSDTPYGPPADASPQTPLLAGRGSRDLSQCFAPPGPGSSSPLPPEGGPTATPQPDPWSPEPKRKRDRAISSRDTGGVLHEAQPTGWQAEASPPRGARSSETATPGVFSFHPEGPVMSLQKPKGEQEVSKPDEAGIGSHGSLSRQTGKPGGDALASSAHQAKASGPSWGGNRGQMDLRNIDESVLRQLPQEIQLEIRLAAARPQGTLPLPASPQPAAGTNRKRRKAAGSERGGRSSKPTKLASAGIKSFFKPG